MALDLIIKMIVSKTDHAQRLTKQRSDLELPKVRLLGTSSDQQATLLRDSLLPTALRVGQSLLRVPPPLQPGGRG